MKRFLTTLMACFVVLSVSSQYNIKGVVLDKGNNRPLEGVTLTLQSRGLTAQTLSAKDGSFNFKGITRKGTYTISTGFIGMETKTLEVEVIETAAALTLELQAQPYFLEPLEIRSTRASERAPFTKTNIGKRTIEQTNLGQDLPFLLNQTPSVVVNSDAGNGFGYTGIRIRGSDGTRVNVTMNGIPYNDAESQGSYFVDLPDIASSLNSIQIQRGVGTSSNGAGAFGGTINLSTNEFNEKAYGSISNTFGSFNTWKHTLRAGTGLIDEHFTVDARLSKISSDGFIDRAATDLRSLYLSTAYFNKKSSVRFNLITGTEKTYQAWNGIPESMLHTNRTYNSAGTEKPGEPYENETDNYQQDHYQLFFNHQFDERISFNTAVFLTKGSGYYEQFKAGAKFSGYGLTNPIVGGTTLDRTDLVRQLWLDNDYYGQIAALRYKKDKNEINIGGGWNVYDGRHFGTVIWAGTSIPKDYEWYRLPARKSDENIYAKWQHNVDARWQLFADLQYRHVNYKIDGFRDNRDARINRNFNFVNPKAGVSYTSGGMQAYFSYAVGNKEPNRNDYEAGISEQPKHETLHDFELGIDKKTTIYSWGATAYYMHYKNQLILTGKINDVGAYTRTNTPASYRLGIELQGGATFAQWINATGNLAFSRNKISNSNEFVDDYDNGGQKLIVHGNKDISFSPSVVGALSLNLLPVKNLEINLPAKYVSRQYLDNTQDIARSLNFYYVQDLRVAYTLKNKLSKQWSLAAQVNNVFNKMYEPNGYTFSYISGGALSTENYYFPMAGTNFLLALNVTF
ncbi:TonB-dependent receptor [Segetibacter sp. 3557_3]|uniref:TonB-dependent receptor n=1 Tax=Segetibacter sp. 3557_3 TaxID=2547429 RepID=UPI00105874E4|nr:TonB-dependent receptor [Segetibacter sp. 3557_3]TDH26479.1 TonB-dependent receptor [Segetibacter sp. 3557_3]